MRTGIVAEKLGMTRLFTDTGEQVPVTVLQVNRCQVVAQRDRAKNGYNALQMGYGQGRVKSMKKPVKGYYAKLNVEPFKKLKEFRVDDSSLLPVGTEVRVDHFQIGQFVDVVGTSLGKGFAGAMKRHNFGGNRASHGASVCHRSLGATGQRQDPGKVFKGKKMAGHLGNEQVTIQNLKVVELDAERGLLFLRGAVPGHKGSLLAVKDAVKKPFKG